MERTRRSPSRKTPAYRRQRRQDGTDLAFVQIAGLRHYLGAHGTSESRQRYHRLIAEWEASGQAAPPAPTAITVVEVANHFLKWAEGYYVKDGKPTSEPANIALALRPLTELYGRTEAAAFGPRALKAVRAKMIADGWCRRYINRQVGMIKRMFKWAVAEELLPASAYHRLQAVAGLRRGRSGVRETEPVRPVPDDLIEPVKRRVSRHVAAMIELQLLTGARPGEIVIVRPCDINRTGRVWQYRPAEHKTQHLGYDRVIFLGPKAQEVLRPFLLRLASTYCFSPGEADQERRAALHERRVTPLSCGNRPGTNRVPRRQKMPGEHYTTQSYGRAIQYACKKAFPPPAPLAKRDDETAKEYEKRLTRQQKAELKEWRRAHHWYPQRLRHNYATRIRREFGLEAAQVLLGHSKADVTQVYAERDVSRAAAVAGKIG